MRFIFLLSLLLSLFLAGTMATCGTCCSTGNCLTAFRGNEGICCGVRAVDDAFSKPYCCPSNAKCIDDNAGGFKCQLMSVDNASAARDNATTNNDKLHNTSSSASSSSGLRWWHWVLIALGSVIALSLVCWGIYRLAEYCRYRNTNKNVVIGHHPNVGRSAEVRL